MAKQAKAYEPSKKVNGFHIRGFQHWDGSLVLNDMEVGAVLDLVAEPDNPHDPQAIAIYFKDSKLGYVPVGESEMLAVMFYYGHANAFEARVLQIDKDADPWEQVRVGIFVRDAR